MHEQFLLQELKLGSHSGKLDGNSRAPEILAMHLSWRNWRQPSWDSRCSFPPNSKPCLGLSLQPDTSSLAAFWDAPNMGNPSACRMGWMCRILMDLSCHYQSELVKKLLSRWHKQALFGNPFLALLLVTGVNIPLVFCSPWGGVSDAVSTPPYRTGCSNSRRQLIFKGMERK